jgi:hypothetical protein
MFLRRQLVTLSLRGKDRPWPGGVGLSLGFSELQVLRKLAQET